MKGKASKKKNGLRGTFEVGGQTFKFTVQQFVIPGKGNITAEEALEDQELLEDMVRKRSGLIKEIF